MIYINEPPPVAPRRKKLLYQNAVASSSSNNADRPSAIDLYATPLRRPKRGTSVDSHLSSSDYDVPPDALTTSLKESKIVGKSERPPDEPRRPSGLRRFSSLRREPPIHFRQEVIDTSTESNDMLLPVSSASDESSKGGILRFSSLRRDLSGRDSSAVPNAQSYELILDRSLEEPKNLLRFSSLRREPPSHFKQEALEKSGYLTKLGGKLKTWSRRWFVLKNGVLSYYKSQADSLRSKPRGEIKLDDHCRIINNEGSTTFQLSVKSKEKDKTYYLCAESCELALTWARILQEAIRRHNLGFSSCLNAKPTVEGWLTKVKNGHSKTCWCVLAGKSFLYFKSPTEINPIGFINMRQTRVQEVQSQSDSDNDDEYDENASQRNSSDSNNSSVKYTIAIIPKYDSSPVYLLLNSKQDFDAWLYHLTVVSSTEITGTPFEHAVSKLMQSDSPLREIASLDTNPGWRDPLLIHSKDSITHPLTTLPSEQLRNEAVQLFKSLQLFTSVPLDSAGIDYHVALVQNSLELCLTHPELQNELYCQIIKQTSPASLNQKNCPGTVPNLFSCATQSFFSCDVTDDKTSPTINAYMPNLSSIGAATKLAKAFKKPPEYSFVQGFQLLALTIPLFLPTGRVMWLLKQHLRRSTDVNTDIGQYAAYCARALERATQGGDRQFRPSRMEVLAILLRNPYQHSLPHSIPVHFLNGTYCVIGFDGSSTVEEFVQLLNKQVNIRDCEKSGFALFSDDPIEKETEHLLDENAKLADIISRWELALRERQLGKFENTKAVRLYYKNRLYLKEHLREATEKERLLLAYQIQLEIMAGRFPITQELVIELCAVLLQIEFGNLSSLNLNDDELLKAILKHYPHHMIDPQRPLLSDVKTMWLQLDNCSTSHCTRTYINCARKWSLCGAQLFRAKALKAIKAKSAGYNSTLVKSDTTVWLAVGDDSISILDLDTMHVIVHYPYRIIIAFGGCREDFMILVNNRTRTSDLDSSSASGSVNGSTSSDNSIHHERMLFAMEKPKILQITSLITDYMNAQPSNRMAHHHDKHLNPFSSDYSHTAERFNISQAINATPLRVRNAALRAKLDVD